MRVRYGAYLHRATGLPVFVSAGNPPDEGPPLGQLMAQVLRDDYGIEAAGVEDRSLTTAENAERSAPMLREAGIHEVLLGDQRLAYATLHGGLRTCRDRGRSSPHRLRQRRSPGRARRSL